MLKRHNESEDMPSSVPGVVIECYVEVEQLNLSYVTSVIVSLLCISTQC